MITWNGLPDLEKAIAKFGPAVDAANATFVREASTMLIREAQANFIGSHPRGTRRPGGATAGRPMVVTGALRRSIVMERMSAGAHQQSARVGPTMVYARSVELKYGYKYFGPAYAMVKTRVQSLADSIYARTFTA